jgi:hypothetical protein
MLQNKYWQAFFALAPILTFSIAISCYIVFLFTIFNQLPELENTSNL